MANVKVSFTIDVDLDAYAAEFHMDNKNKKDLRFDVKVAAEQAAQDYFERIGVLNDGP